MSDSHTNINILDVEPLWVGSPACRERVQAFGAWMGALPNVPLDISLTYGPLDPTPWAWSYRFHDRPQVRVNVSVSTYMRDGTLFEYSDVMDPLDGDIEWSEGIMACLAVSCTDTVAHIQAAVMTRILGAAGVDMDSIMESHDNVTAANMLSHHMHILVIDHAIEHMPDLSDEDRSWLMALRTTSVDFIRNNTTN